MTVRIKFFASLRESVGADLMALEISSMAALREALSAELSSRAYAALCADGVRLAINQKFIDDHWQHSSLELPAGAEVAFLPPVTGG